MKTTIILICLLVLVQIIFSFVSIGKIITLPTNIKCALQENECEKNDFTINTLFTSLIYLLIGYFIPDQYMVVILTIYAYQAFNLLTSRHTSLIIDPLANLTGYLIGSAISPKQSKFFEKYKIVD